VLLLVAVSLVACGKHHVAASLPGTPSARASGPAALAPPNGDVVAPESCGAVTVGNDGTAEPVICPDGRPNQAAVRYYAAFHSHVLALGPTATAAQVQAAICADFVRGQTTLPIEELIVTLAQAEQAGTSGPPLTRMSARSRWTPAVRRPRPGRPRGLPPAHSPPSRWQARPCPTAFPLTLPTKERRPGCRRVRPG